MDSEISGEFGVERDAEELALPSHDDTFVNLREHLAIPPRPGDERGADEHTGKRRPQPMNKQRSLEGFFLTAESVPADRHIHRFQQSHLSRVSQRLRQQNTASARPHNSDIIVGDAMAKLCTYAITL